jgi:rfaE bifunctional protein nucleotidyltransferase chain/domain
LSGALLTVDEAIVRFGREKRNGSVVFTAGCFDLLHPGHIRMLEEARSLGDALLVGIAGDAGVQKLRGPSHPLIPDRERAELMAALECVDAVVIFEKGALQTLIAKILPDVLVRGSNDEEDLIAGQADVEAAGGRVVRISALTAFSNSEILRRVREMAGSPSQH